MSKDLAAVVQFVELVGGAGGDGFGRVVTAQQRPDAVVGRRDRPDAAILVQLVELLAAAAHGHLLHFAGDGQ
jgi:hypothetical protein